MNILLILIKILVAVMKRFIEIQINKLNLSSAAKPKVKYLSRQSATTLKIDLTAIYWITIPALKISVTISRRNQRKSMAASAA